MKKAIAYFILVIIVLGSCKKDPALTKNGLNVQTSSVTQATPIKAAQITGWLNKNPVVKYLTLNWDKAQQASIGGVAVVKIPVQIRYYFRISR